MKSKKRQARKSKAADKISRLVGGGKTQQEAWNKTSVQLVKAAAVSVIVYIYSKNGFDIIIKAFQGAFTIYVHHTPHVFLVF